MQAVDVRLITEGIASAIELTGVSSSLNSISSSVADISKKLDNIKKQGGGILPRNILNTSRLQDNLNKLSEITYEGNIDEKSIKSINDLKQFIDVVRSMTNAPSFLKSVIGIKRTIASLNYFTRQAKKIKFDKELKENFNDYFFSEKKGNKGILILLDYLGNKKSKEATNNLRVFADNLRDAMKRLSRTILSVMLAEKAIPKIQYVLGKNGIGKVIKNLPETKSLIVANSSMKKIITISELLNTSFKKLTKAGLSAVIAGVLFKPIINSISKIKDIVIKINSIDKKGKELINANNTLTSLNKVLNKLKKSFSTAIKLGLEAIPAGIGILASTLAIKSINVLLKGIDKINSRSLSASKKKVTKITAITAGLGTCFATAIVAGVFAIPAAVGIAAASLTVILMSGLLTLVSKLAKTTAKGVLTLAAISGSLLMMAFAFKKISEAKIDFKNMGIFVGTIVGAVAVVSLAGLALPIILPGTIAIGTMGLSLILFASSLSLISMLDVDFKTVSQNLGGALSSIVDGISEAGVAASFASAIISVSLIPMSLGLIAFAATIAVWNNLSDMDVLETETDANGNVRVKKTGEKVKIDTKKVTQNIGDTVSLITDSLTGKGFDGFLKSMGNSVASSVICTLLIPMSLGLIAFAATIAVWNNLMDMDVLETETDENGNIKVKKTGEKVKIDVKKVAKNIGDTVSIVNDSLTGEGFFGFLGSMADSVSSSVVGTLLIPMSLGLLSFAATIAVWNNLSDMDVLETETDENGNIKVKRTGEKVKVDTKKVAKNIGDTISLLYSSINWEEIENISDDGMKILKKSLFPLSNSLMSFSRAISSWVSLESFQMYDENGKPIGEPINVDINTISSNMTKVFGEFIKKITTSLKGIDFSALNKNIRFKTIEDICNLFDANSISSMENSIKLNESGYILLQYADVASGFVSALGTEEMEDAFDRLGSNDTKKAISNLSKLSDAIKVVHNCESSLPKISSMVSNVVDKINTLDVDKTSVLSKFFKAASELSNPKFKVEQGIDYIKEMCKAIVEELKENNNKSQDTVDSLHTLTEKAKDKVKDIFAEKDDNKDNKDKKDKKENISSSLPQEIRIYLNDIEDSGNGFYVTRR